MLFQGPMVSAMISIPANALSIWRCTLSTSDSGTIAFFEVRYQPLKLVYRVCGQPGDGGPDPVGIVFEGRREFRTL